MSGSETEQDPRLRIVDLGRTTGLPSFRRSSHDSAWRGRKESQARVQSSRVKQSGTNLRHGGTPQSIWSRESSALVPLSGPLYSRNLFVAGKLPPLGFTESLGCHCQRQFHPRSRTRNPLCLMDQAENQLAIGCRCGIQCCRQSWIQNLSMLRTRLCSL